MVKKHPAAEAMMRSEVAHPWCLIGTFTSGEISAPVLLIKEIE